MRSGKISYSFDGDSIKLSLDLGNPVELALALVLMQSLNLRGYKGKGNLTDIAIGLNEVTKAVLRGASLNESRSKQVQEVSRKTKASPRRRKPRRSSIPSV